MEVDVGPPKFCVCERGLDRCVLEDMKDISNVKVHVKTRSRYLINMHMYDLFSFAWSAVLGISMYCNINIEKNSVYTYLGLHRLLKMLLNHISRRPQQAIFVVLVLYLLYAD